MVDGTRRETFEQLFELRVIVTRAIGEVPSVVAVNKVDLVDQWQITDEQFNALDESKWHRLKTSAKTGEGVEEAFSWIATTMLTGRQT